MPSQPVTQTIYRVTWQRRGSPSKSKLFRRLAAAEKQLAKLGRPFTVSKSIARLNRSLHEGDIVQPPEIVSLQVGHVVWQDLSPVPQAEREAPKPKVVKKLTPQQQKKAVANHIRALEPGAIVDTSDLASRYTVPIVSEMIDGFIGTYLKETPDGWLRVD